MGKTFRLWILIIALVFAAITVCGVATVFAFSDELTLSALAYGSGTQSDPYRLYNSTQLLNLQEIADSKKSEEYTKDKFFRLESDITATRVPRVGGGFFGTLDGGGHTVTLKRYGLFYTLHDGASIENIDIKIDFKNAYNKYGLCHDVKENALISNCNVRGDIDFDFTPLIGKKANAASFDSSVFAVYNQGTISDCSYSGNVYVRSGVAVGVLDFGVISLSNSGTVKNCKVDCNMDVNMTFVGRLSVCGVANRAENCTYTGNIYVKYAEQKSMYRYCRVNIYGLGRTVTDCTYKGELYLDMSYGEESRKKAVVAEEGSYEVIRN